MSCLLAAYSCGRVSRFSVTAATLLRLEIGASFSRTSRFSVWTAGPQGNWEVPEEWSIRDVSADRGLLSVSRIVQLPHTMESLIVDSVSRKVLRRSASGENAPQGDFADYGRAICDGSDADAADRAPVSCWEVDTGEKIGEAPTINGGDPIGTAQHASRIVASDYRREKIPVSRDSREDFRRRVIWDFRTGKELVSWRPNFQSWDFQLFVDPQKPLEHVSQPFRFAISPDGQYIAEGGDGSIHLYKIKPSRLMKKILGEGSWPSPVELFTSIFVERAARNADFLASGSR